MFALNVIFFFNYYLSFFTCDFSGSTDCLQYLGGACAIEKKVKVLEEENLKLRLEVCKLKAFIGFLSCYFEVALFYKIEEGRISCSFQDWFILIKYAAECK